MDELRLDTFAAVTLDAGGGGRVQLGPRTGEMWRPTVAGVSTNTAAKLPQCSIYVGSAANPISLVDHSYTGHADSTSRISGTVVYPGHSIWAVWSGGDPGAVATLSLFGTKQIGYRRP